MAAPEPTPVRQESVVVLFDKFLDWRHKHRSAATYDCYSQRLNEFAPRVGQLKPYHLQEWIDTKRSPGHQRGCVTAVQRAMNWSVKQGHIDHNPICHMKKPTGGKRERYVSNDEYSTILLHTSDECFRDLVTLCWETGGRPQEVFQLEARHFDEAHRRIVIPITEAKGRRKSRVIFLTDMALQIVQLLCRIYPNEKIMRNSNGAPWNRNNVACRFARLMKHLGRKVSLDEFAIHA
ncbi:MAG: tyrosine-type recombinase/integrase [Thermomicrobiales bacterium]